MKLPADYNKLTYAERRKVREEYMRLQDNNCYYCWAPLDGPPEKEIAGKKVTKLLFPGGFFNNPVHLHHSHVTGLTLGAVHAHCNAVLWEYEGE